jgi:cytochrome c oxidase assembly factor CtaG
MTTAFLLALYVAPVLLVFAALAAIAECIERRAERRAMREYLEERFHD